MNRVRSILIAISLIAGCASVPVAPSSSSPIHFRAAFSGQKGPTNCATTTAILDVFAQKSDPDVLFIVVSHLGDGEAKPNLNIRRLHNVRTYLTEFILRKYRRKPGT